MYPLSVYKPQTTSGVPSLPPKLLQAIAWFPYWYHAGKIEFFVINHAATLFNEEYKKSCPAGIPHTFLTDPRHEA